MSKSDKFKLSMAGLPVMENLNDFSRLTHISNYTLFQLSKYSDKYYKHYYIPKKSGKPRLISQPCRKLKGIQSWILNNILDKLCVSNSCKGFSKGTSIIDNVDPHKHSSVVLTIDIKDFFPSIRRDKVYNIFKAIGYNKFMSTIFTNLCTCNGALPQGGPCSPKLANLSAWTLDVRIQGYVGRRGITYTRYADDLTFSTTNPQKLIKRISTITSIIEDEKLHINPSKTRIAGSARARKVTGLIITNESFGIGRQVYLKVRAKIHHLTLNREQKNFDLINEVQGWLAYLKNVDKLRYKKAADYIRSLKEKYPATLISQIILPPLILEVATVITAVE
ncbi:retron St85 family RNA-directed DNA polymerase [Flavisolibacter ginsenosidimutans]|uniref:RNA-directed DNA polymerase n=1 Tax=Flavisolibacter ginsenosidimutans TaxID=661481 RepID=A0A5B8UKL1_9BACT|nr:retron St85 family RNA-directed DNA polymerase [Flavisolibacter ginsenosidimutans]QEC57103.1 RNA-directed DNA polymerase [Flavisolibacter ginsenosidimutans]